MSKSLGNTVAHNLTISAPYWFERDEKDLLPEGYTNEHSPNGIFKKEKDIMDVWFDSGSSHTGVMVERGFNYPVDLYFEDTIW